MNAIMKEDIAAAQPAADSPAATERQAVHEATLAEIRLNYPLAVSKQEGGSSSMFARGDLAEWLCYRENATHTEGILCVSRDHEFHALVMDYEQRLDLMNKRYNKKLVSVQDIRALNQSAGAASIGSVADEQGFIMQILREGERLKASDVHIQVRPDVTIVRFRVHGRIRTYWGSRTPAEGKAWLKTLFSTMCHEQSHSTLSDREDSKANLRPEFAAAVGLSGARFHSRPMKGYLVCVLRLNAIDDGQDTIEDIGFLKDRQLPLLKYLLTHVHGVIIVSGATGHGKSRTIKTFVETYCAKRNQEIHFMTGENPIEYNIRGISVVQTPVYVNPDEPDGESKAWMRFIKSALRSDPDGIAPGELLDIHSAMTGVMAAQTGHLVLTTLHVSDAIGILQRLRGMGVPDDVLFDPSIFVGLINQSLLPKLCQRCAVKLADVIQSDGSVSEKIIDPDLFKRLKKLVPDLSKVRLRAYDPEHAASCPDCGGIGENGRLPAAEICIPDGEFMDIYQGQGGGKRRARKHWVMNMKGFTKHMHALQLIREGIVDPATTEEIIGPLDRDLVEIGEEVLGLMYGNC